jgi:cytochrome b6-f complex iron-sulfur subunit
MSRREFLTYAWGAAMAFFAAEAGIASFLFLYPRFREGEFGGKFRLPESTLPDPTAPPVSYTDGKFWLVQTDEGQPKAIYMVCTHLGCLYKWASSNNRFECPCHGSKFSHDGFYIEGPAPRSLDSFELVVENGEIVVDTGAKITGAPAAESPARAQV